MPAVTFSEAARALNFRSRSTLFRLRDAGSLADYLRPPLGSGGASLLELTPKDLPSLAEHVNRCIRPQINNEARHRRARPDPRWGVVAGVLSDALADCGSLSLCAAEAAAIAAALPDAMAEGFGDDWLELLRVALADAGCWRAGPGTPATPDSEREWWGDDGWGRWEPGEPLEDDPFWEHVAAITAGMMGGRFAPLSGGEAVELHRQLQEAIGAVEAGARFDATRWDAASARMLLADPDVSSGAQPLSLPELQRLADGGRLPPDLQAQVAAAIAAYAARRDDDA